VAVLLDDKVKAAPGEITNLVTAAAGIDGQRGDVVTVAAMAFDHSATEAAAKEQKTRAAATSKAELMNLVRTGGVVLIVLVALLLAWRSARKASVTRYPVPGMLPAGPVPAEALHAALAAFGSGVGGSGSPAVGDGSSSEPGGLDAVGPGGFERAALPSAPAVNDELAELIDRQPDEVASILRGWLADRRA
jgi:flagellar M-ring protein FliF